MVLNEKITKNTVIVKNEKNSLISHIYSFTTVFIL